MAQEDSNTHLVVFRWAISILFAVLVGVIAWGVNVITTKQDLTAEKQQRTDIMLEGIRFQTSWIAIELEKLHAEQRKQAELINEIRWRAKQ